jgi:hypothetical protein
VRPGAATPRTPGGGGAATPVRPGAATPLRPGSAAASAAPSRAASVCGDSEAAVSFSKPVATVTAAAGAGLSIGGQPPAPQAGGGGGGPGSAAVSRELSFTDTHSGLPGGGGSGAVGLQQHQTALSTTNAQQGDALLPPHMMPQGSAPPAAGNGVCASPDAPARAVSTYAHVDSTAEPRVIEKVKLGASGLHLTATAAHHH